jgi:uncharacterized protein YegJ (DUF2314 family)
MNKFIAICFGIFLIGATVTYLNQNYESLSAAVTEGIRSGAEEQQARQEAAIAPIFASLATPEYLFLSDRQKEQEVYRASRPHHDGFLARAAGGDTEWTNAAVQVLTAEKAQRLWLADLQADGDGKMSGEVVLSASPYGIQVGDRYTFDKFEVLDFAITRGGKVFGLYTLRQTLADLPGDVAAQVSAQLSGEPVPADW